MIIGIPVAVAVRVLLLNQRANVRDSAAQANLRNALTAQQAYCSANGTYVPVTPGSESNGSNDNITDYGFSQGDPAVSGSGTSQSFIMQATGEYLSQVYACYGALPPGAPLFCLLLRSPHIRTYDACR